MFGTVDEVLRHVKTCDGFRAPKQEPKPLKYHNRRTPYESPLWGVRTYDSKAEAGHAAWLDDQVKAGELIWWMPQPKVALAGLIYRPDFMVGRPEPSTDALRIEFVDVKGAETQRFRDIRKLWKKHARFSLRIVKRGKPDEVIEPEHKRDDAT